jgi:hypothetical protein
MAKILAFAALFAMLGLTFWAAYQQWELQLVDVPGWGWGAIVAGGGLSLLVGVGLMALVFYSSRMGYDEPPHERERDGGPQ